MQETTKEKEIGGLKHLINGFTGFEEKHTWIDHLIAPCIVTVVIFLVYAIKGVYPFGVNTVAYNDLPCNFIAVYTYFWDVLHGDAGLYLNLYSGLGVSMADLTGAFLFCPINLLLYLSSRDGLIYFMSFFVAIKIVLSALTMSFYYKKHYKDLTFTVCAGVLYSCCGFVIQFYTNPFFLDYVIIFPLLVYAYERMLKEHKYALFAILMFFTSFMYFQLLIPVMIYLLLKAYFILREVEGDKRADSIKILFIIMILCFMVAAFNLLPLILQLLSSSRVGTISGFNYYDAMKGVHRYDRYQKYFMLYGSEAAIAVMLMIWLKGARMIRKYSANMILIALIALPIIHEGINLLWHGGSYKGFPLRFGYMITFECIILFGEFCRNNDFADIRINSRIIAGLSIAGIIGATVASCLFFRKFLYTGTSNLMLYQGYGILISIFAAAYLLILLNGSAEIRKILLCIMIIIQASLGCYGFIAPKLASIDSEKNTALTNCINAHEYFENHAVEGRIKTDSGSYIPNGGMIIGAPDIGSWLNGLDSDTEMMLRERMGYDGITSAVYDSGGTVFSDALLGVTAAVSLNNPNELLYDTREDAGFIHDSRYTMPFGLITDSDIPDSSHKAFDFQNDLFSDITGLNVELISKYDIADLTAERKEISVTDYVKEYEQCYIEDDVFYKSMEYLSAETDAQNESISDDFSDDVAFIYEYNVETKIEGLKSAYLMCDGNDGQILLIANEVPVNTKCIGDDPGKIYDYPNTLKNGILPLGTYNDSDLKFKIYSDEEELKDVKIGLLDLEVLEKGINEVKNRQDLDISFAKSGMRVTGKINRAGRLLLPMGYSDNWKAEINGADTKIIPCVNGGLISVDVPEGEVDIQFKYQPKGLKEGIIISVVGIIAAIAAVVLAKRRKENCEENRSRVTVITDRIIYHAFYTVFAIVILVLYVIPMWIKMAL